MRTPQDVVRGLTAPERLGLNTRVEIRKAASQLLDEMPEGSGRLVIDLSYTREIDSAGLGALMLIQRHASERRQAVALRHAERGDPFPPRTHETLRPLRAGRCLSERSAARSAAPDYGRPLGKALVYAFPLGAAE